MSGKISAIVLAAGNGRRMNSKTKKQYIMIKGKPVLWYSLFAFEQSKTDEVILVTSKDDIEYCQNEIVDKYNLKKVKKIVEGGAERYNSVYNGLKEATGDIVLIHDGARPMDNRKIIEECIAGAESYKACVAAVRVKDTIKISTKDNIIDGTPDRNTLWSIQTPQAFSTSLVKEAYEKMMQDQEKNITDDAMVVEEYSNFKVKIVEGDYKNIKITTPEDIYIAEMFLKQTQNIV